MAITASDAQVKLVGRYWNKNSKTEANPGGMGANGHVENLPDALEGVGVVAEDVGTKAAAATAAAELVGPLADNIMIVAGLASEVADVAAASAAIATVADNIEEIEAAPAAAIAASSARDDAEAAAALAQAAVGGVRISGDDTIAGSLSDKIEVAGGLVQEVINPGANEKLRLTVPPVTDLIGNIMAVAWNVVELQGASLSGYANMIVDAFENVDGIDAGETTFAVYDAVNRAFQSAADEVTISYVTHSNQTSITDTYTFAATALGTAAADRTILVGVATRNTNATKPTGLTVAGEAAALSVETWPSGSGAGISFWRVALPTGATGNIVVTCPDSQAGCAIGVWAVYGPQAIADTDEAEGDGGSRSLSLDVPAGAAIAAMFFLSGAQGEVTWTGATERFEQAATFGVGVEYSGADVMPGAPGIAAITAANNSGGGWEIALGVALEPDIGGARDLVSVALSAASDPAALLIGAEVAAPGAIVLGTDLILYGSIDDGVTWEEVAAYQTYATAGGRLLVFGTADVTGQTGTDVRLRAEAADGEIIIIHKWGVQADVALTPPA